MIGFIENFFETFYLVVWLLFPFIFGFGTVHIVKHLFFPSDEEFERNMLCHIEKELTKDYKRQRRAAKRRLRKYKREFRRRVKHDAFIRKENAYLVDFMRKN